MLFYFNDEPPSLHGFKAWADCEFNLKRGWAFEQVQNLGRNFFVVKFIKASTKIMQLKRDLGIRVEGLCTLMHGIPALIWTPSSLKRFQCGWNFHCKTKFLNLALENSLQTRNTHLLPSRSRAQQVPQ
jgi:hypothetical protein